MQVLGGSGFSHRCPGLAMLGMFGGDLAGVSLTPDPSPDVSVPWGLPVFSGLGGRWWQGKLTFPSPGPGSVNPLENLSKAIKPLPWKVHIHRHPWVCTFQRVLDSMKTIHGSLVLAVPTFPTSSQHCSYHAIAPRHHCCHFLNVPYSSTLPYFCICSLSAICFSSLSL